MDNSIKISFKGRSSGYCSVSLGDIKRIQQTIIKVRCGEQIDHYTGILLKDILARIGADIEQLSGIRFVADNGYSVEVTPAIFQRRRILFAYQINGNDLPDKDQPLRVIIPDEREMYWVNNLAEVQLLEIQEDHIINEMMFFENLVGKLNRIDYSYDGQYEQAVSLQELLRINTKKRIIVKGIDGLVKKETLEIKKHPYFIILTGQAAPLFTAPAMPRGMEVKNMGALFADKCVIVFLNRFFDEGKNVRGVHLYEFLKDYLPDTKIMIHMGGKKQISLLPDELKQKLFICADGEILLK